MSDNTVRPKLTIFSEHDMARIHEGALKVMEKTGVLVESQRAREVFARGGKSVRFDGDRVTFDRDIAEWAIRAAPSTYDIYNRRGEPAFTLGNSPARFGNGVTNL